MAWALAVILVPRLLAAAAVAAAAAAVVTSRGDVTVVCHDLEMVEVTWGLGPNHQGANLSLEFRYGTGALRPCPQYFLSGAGVTSGCILPAARVGLLELALRDGGGAMVFKARQRASTWLKPSPPRNLTLLWTPDGDVAVSWPAHSYLGLDYEVQHRENSNGNEDAWQTTSGPCCDLMVGGLDPARCYDFRVRASPRAAHYGLEAQPSEWTAVTKLSGAASTEPLPPQAWIADAQATAPPARTEEEDDLIRPKAKRVEPEDGTFLCTVPRPPSFESRGQGGGAMVSVGGATFMVGDSGYMTL
ncbi:cytokine receptor-like factor 2 isoform X7 [Mus caroli]|uniref:Cytokine receptor-like factor 2 n=1 Tax=Mus caroli TaxID=10089 RepID=A0A6P5P743_MUSCR|nr:cytokine receptor-like factor 2 isoform X7 [Mus caroli]